jgi:hypothetical protein
MMHVWVLFASSMILLAMLIHLDFGIAVFRHDHKKFTLPNGDSLVELQPMPNKI